MKTIITGFLISFISLNSFSQVTQIKCFPLSSVRLTSGPFYDAQQADLKYILELNTDRLLAPFLVEAGLTPKAEKYGSWENTGLDGHIGGHYLSALSNLYAATGNEELLKRLNYMIDQLAECQNKNGNGYVGGIPGGKAMWNDISNGKINAASFSLNTKWVPLYNIHKLYAGLRDAYQIAGNKKALDVLVKLTDWCVELTKNLTDDQIQLMLKSEQGGLNEVFADVYNITGNQKYLVLARRFSDKVILNPLLEQKDVLTGLHANTQIPKVIGYKRIADLSNDKNWDEAAGFFWNTVVTKRTVSIGGNSVKEHFNPADDFSSMVESVQGPETCNTYNMLRLTKLLYLSDPQGKYLDYYERAVFNHILSSQHPKGGFVYFTPMRPNHFRVYSEPQLDFWCCVGSGLENHGKYGELIYSHNERDMFINMFIASTLEWKEKGISLTQETQFPYEEKSELKITLNKTQKFSINIRKPVWVKEGDFKLQVNGKDIKLPVLSGAYYPLERNWKTGDRVTIICPMHTSAEYLPDNSQWVSFVHGPIVLAAATTATDLTGLRSDGSRNGHIANGPQYPIAEAPMIVTIDKNFVEKVKPEGSQPMVFSASDLILPEKYRDLKLVPFYTLHDTRYIIYWQVKTQDSLKD
ncbi:MAG TPA: glycoside hydrolase family 127 protein [Bacteroidales bacterium]